MTRPPTEDRSPGPRFPDFDVLSQSERWDSVTAGVVLARLGPQPPLRHFTPEQEAVARPLLDLILDQHDGTSRLPVVEVIDSRLAEMVTDGWRYDDMPHDPEAWTASLEALDGDARSRFAHGYPDCTDAERTLLLEGLLELGAGEWHGMVAAHVWSLWYRYACSALYAHPWTWNEIGFPGPAYPRGYKNSGVNEREPFEVADHRAVDPVQDA